MLNNGNNSTHYDQVKIVPVVQRATAPFSYLIDAQFIRSPFYKQGKAKQTRFRARGDEHIAMVLRQSIEWLCLT